MREFGSSVQGGEWSTEKLELNRQHRAFWSLSIGLVVAHVAEAGTGEELDVEACCLEGLGVEPEVRRQISDGHASMLQRDDVPLARHSPFG